LAVLALVGVTALAVGSKQNVVISSDGRQAIATKAPSAVYADSSDSDAALTTIAGNLSRYPFGTFFCCYGNTIAGISSPLGFEVWLAIPFTPSANATVTKVKTSVGYITNSDVVFNLSLNNDSGGLPGTAIKTFHASASNAFGSCCALVTGSSTGIPVTAGTQYWVVVSTSDKKHGGFFGAWAFNSTDMRNEAIASYCNSTGTQCGSNNGKWVGFQSLRPAFGVLGH
jgi:hypothetical protein